MATEKSTNIFINLEALFQARLNSEKKELRQEILEEKLNELLKREVFQEATFREFLKQMKRAGTELWELASATPIVEIARIINDIGHIKKRLQQRRYRRRPTSPNQLEKLKTRVLKLLRSSKEPKAAEDIYKALSLGRSFLRPVLQKLLASKQIISQGNKRSTRYLLPLSSVRLESSLDGSTKRSRERSRLPKPSPRRSKAPTNMLRPSSCLILFLFGTLDSINRRPITRLVNCS